MFPGMTTHFTRYYGKRNRFVSNNCRHYTKHVVIQKVNSYAFSNLAQHPSHDAGQSVAKPVSRTKENLSTPSQFPSRQKGGFAPYLSCSLEQPSKASGVVV